MTYTAAPMDGIRRIRFSCGDATTRSREEYEVSGPWLENHDESSSPAILGQWISETDEMSLGLGKKIIGVEVWVSRGHFVTSERYYVGRVVRLSVVTSRGQVKCVPAIEPTSVGGWTVIRFRRSRLEEVVRPLPRHSDPLYADETGFIHLGVQCCIQPPLSPLFTSPWKSH